MQKSLFSMTVVIFSFIAGAALSGGGGGDGGSQYPGVQGVMGVIPALENSCVAVWLPIPDGLAVSGLHWFNNDGAVAFPGLYLESGDVDQPVALLETVQVAENVFGVSAGWSEVFFSEPFTCASSGLYVVFHFPAGLQATGYGEGGGPAIGFVGDGAGASGWLCADGISWDRIGGDFGFAVVPEFVQAEPGMVQLNGSGGQSDELPSSVGVITALNLPFPNPFNPETEISFTLARDTEVKLTVFDLRGRKVADLANGLHAAGKHSYPWSGKDGSGRRVASGVYFVRFQADDVTMHYRLVMVK